MSEEYTTIKLRKSTVQRLKEIGRKNQTYDDIINILISEFYEKQVYKITRDGTL